MTDFDTLQTPEENVLDTIEKKERDISYLVSKISRFLPRSDLIQNETKRSEATCRYVFQHMQSKLEDIFSRIESVYNDLQEAEATLVAIHPDIPIRSPPIRPNEPISVKMWEAYRRDRFLEMIREDLTNLIEKAQGEKTKQNKYIRLFQEQCQDYLDLNAWKEYYVEPKPEIKSAAAADIKSVSSSTSRSLPIPIESPLWLYSGPGPKYRGFEQAIVPKSFVPYGIRGNKNNK
jgi:hypothetical protein